MAYQHQTVIKTLAPLANVLYTESSGARAKGSGSNTNCIQIEMFMYVVSLVSLTCLDFDAAFHYSQDIIAILAERHVTS